jgi:hypothetical protein
MTEELIMSRSRSFVLLRERAPASRHFTSARGFTTRAAIHFRRNDLVPMDGASSSLLVARWLEWLRRWFRASQ